MTKYKFKIYTDYLMPGGPSEPRLEYHEVEDPKAWSEARMKGTAIDNIEWELCSDAEWAQARSALCPEMSHDDFIDEWTK